MADDRPDPDALLASLQREETRARRGRLKVFLGMCPGVGKTFAMLRAAHRELAEGVDVVAAVVETHGRKETEALLAGLPSLARKPVIYRGATLEEMDLEGLLSRRPRLALVDELAHTNAPGSRHPKRWQDVVELLDAGISVTSTLNVQHLESRADAVRQITGVPVQETVPDSILDLADEIELVDLTPKGLRERLREGKVYLGERAAAAAENFFQEANLAALRELALRVTAERVDRQLREMRVAGAKRVVWRSGERLLVAVGPSPFSTQLVRWTRRMSAALGAPWIALHVESSAPLKPDARQLLDRNLTLARELGAEVIVTHDDDIAGALVRVALEHNATQIVIGKPRGRRWIDWLRGGSLIDRLVRAGGSIDIYAVPAEEAPPRRALFEAGPRSAASEYTVAVAVVAAVSVANWIVADLAGYRSVGLIYLVSIIALGMRIGRGPVVFAGLLAAALWNFFFIPPRFTFVIRSFEDGMLYVATVAAALAAGSLTSKIRAQARNERLREQRATALLDLTRALAQSRTLDDGVFTALRQADRLFDAQTALALADEANDLSAHFAGSYPLDEKERAVADWAFRNRRSAGKFTDTLPASEGYYVPLLGEKGAVGVLGVKTSREASLSLAQRDLIEAFASQLAWIVERENLRAASEREKLLAESEKLHQVLLDSVSHELRTPLSVIAAVLENLLHAGPALTEELLKEGGAAVRRLNRLVGNLLDQTRLETGTLKPRPVWCGADEIIHAAADDTRDALAGHALEVSVPPDLPAIHADFSLTEQALVNLLVNASVHTPPGTPIFLTAGADRGGRRVYFTVADRGPGFPPQMRERLFTKFARGDAAHAGGLGLGLSIARGFIVAQHGDVVVGENPGGGAVITLYLPQDPSKDGVHS